MPSAPPRVCSRCQRTVPPGQRCRCGVGRSPTTTSAWNSYQGRKLRKIKIANDPWCQYQSKTPGVGRSPVCNRPAEHVDHIRPVAEDPKRVLDYENLQSICVDHHRQKTNADRNRLYGKDIGDYDEFTMSAPWD